MHYGDISLVTKDGTSIDVEFFSKVTSFDDRQIIQCSVYNISKRKRTETAQKIARKNLDMFSSRIRHDILNQLMIVSGSLELASYSIQDPDLQKHLNRAQTATKTIQKQILFTREFEDLGAEIPTWQIVPTAIHHAFLDIETDSITLNVQQDDIEVFADPLFEKVFYLLFDFAHRFGEKVTRIDVVVVADEVVLESLGEDDADRQDKKVADDDRSIGSKGSRGTDHQTLLARAGSRLFGGRLGFGMQRIAKRFG